MFFFLLDLICPDGFQPVIRWQPPNNNCYKYIKENATYSEAKDNCSRLSAHIAEPRNKLENEAIFLIAFNCEKMKTYSTTGLYKINIWIGANDIKEEGTFVWESDGQVVDWRNK